MKVWVVNADDHGYDYSNQWHVGVFSTLEKAHAAMKQDREEYAGHLPNGPNYQIIEAEIDVRKVP